MISTPLAYQDAQPALKALVGQIKNAAAVDMMDASEENDECELSKRDLKEMDSKDLQILCAKHGVTTTITTSDLVSKVHGRKRDYDKHVVRVKEKSEAQLADELSDIFKNRSSSGQDLSSSGRCSSSGSRGSSFSSRNSTNRKGGKPAKSPLDKIIRSVRAYRAAGGEINKLSSMFQYKLNESEIKTLRDIYIDWSLSECTLKALAHKGSAEYDSGVRLLTVRMVVQILVE